MSLYYNKTRRTTVRRHAERGQYDREAIDAILDEGLVGHVGFVADGHPYAIPMLYARNGEEIYLHGSPRSRLLEAVAGGIEICLTVTLIDGLVLARSAFHHSVNYRSVTVLGTCRPIRDPGPKREALRTIVEHMVPGRPDDVRGPSDAELDVTEVLALTIDEAAAKVRSGPPIESRKDLELDVWAGELPLRLVAQAPHPDSHCELVPPAYLNDYERARV